MDKTAQIRYPKLKPGPRIKQFVDDQLDTISLVGCGSIIRVEVNGVTFPDAIYKLARNPLLHEGELDKKISFSSEVGLQIGDKWNLPPQFVLGLCIGVVVAKENSDELVHPSLGCTIWNKRIHFNELWGKPTIVKNAIEDFVRSIA